MAESGNDFLESKESQYGHFKHILFWAGLALLLGTFGVIWMIS